MRDHHVVALSDDGVVYTLGRGDDGCLGVLDPTSGGATKETDEPLRVDALDGKSVAMVGTGANCSFAITADGHLYSWGFGENLQLGNGEEQVRNSFKCWHCWLCNIADPIFSND